MIIARVVGKVWCAQQRKELKGLTLSVTRPDAADGAAGPLLVAVDLVGAAVGDRVLVVLGETAATLADASVDAAIAGIVEHLDVQT